MPDNNSAPSNFDWRRTTFEGACREQLRRWAQLPLEQILLAIEEMQDIAQMLGTAPTGEYGEFAPGSSVKEPLASYGKSAGPHDIELPSCTPEPLMAYLKALGILRLVSEQKDPNARGWWKNDVFCLRASLLFKDAATEEAKRNALTKFFLDQYQPTPIVGPWAGGSGFFSKDNKQAVEDIRKSQNLRVQTYAKVIQTIEEILRKEGIEDKPSENEKDRLINRYRRELPDEVVAWMDAAMVLREDGQSFSPLLGTGGNDGRLDFTQNFMQRIIQVGLHKTQEKSITNNQSSTWITQALFSTPVSLFKASVGQFAPGQIGGPNGTQGFEGTSIINPWDFILMMEGSLLLAGAAARRLGAIGKSRATFPFTVRTVAAGFDASAEKDETESRGEIWLPLWTRPTSACDLRQLFGEGRAEVSGRPARTGTDFARAIAGLGVDRGITGFARLAFLKRSGKAFLATSIGRFAVTERQEADLLRQIDPWLNAFRRVAGDKKAPPRLRSPVRRIDSAIFDFCKYGGSSHLQRILTALGKAECELTKAERLREEKKIKPLAGLSPDWIKAAEDGSAEFDIACALASIYDPEAKIGPLRANLEPVDWKKRCRAWAEKDRAIVWNAADPAANLSHVLQRRVMDGQRVGCERLPLASRFTVPLGTVSAFLEGDLDEQRIEDLIWGLMLIDHQGVQHNGGHETGDRSIPRNYALLKLLFLPRSIVADRATGTLYWRLARNGEAGTAIRPELRILSLLQAGRVDEACRIAAQRLRVSGLPPMPGALPDGRMRDHTWSEYAIDHQGAKRLVAALLIPIGSESVNRLIQLVCRDQTALAKL